MKKLIYSNDRIGEIGGEFFDNEYTGVFGQVVDISKVIREDKSIPNILTSESRNDEYSYRYTFGASHYFVDLGSGYMSILVSATRNHYLNYHWSIAYNYTSPIENVTADMITVKFTYKVAKFATSGVAIGSMRDVQRFFEVRPENESADIPLSTNVDLPESDNSGIVTTTVEEYITVSNLEINSFSVKFNVDYTKTLFGSVNIDYLVFANTIVTNVVQMTLYQPISFEITVRGDTYTVTPQAFRYGSAENAYEIPSNTLITTKTTHAGKNYTEYLYEKMAGINGEWANGKRSFNIEVVSGHELLTVDDAVIPLDARKGRVDESNPVSINSAAFQVDDSNQAIEFEITSAEFRYNGASRQIIDILEKTNSE